MNFDEITVGMVNSQFRKWHIRKVQDALESELKTSVKKFFNFLAEEKGIKNEKILNSFNLRKSERDSGSDECDASPHFGGCQ